MQVKIEKIFKDAKTAMNFKEGREKPCKKDADCLQFNVYWSVG